MLRFGVFEMDLTTGELRKGGRIIHLPPQPFKILALLASRQGQLVTREEIQQKIWGSETFVDFEHGLNYAIKKIRDMLGDDDEAPGLIETLPRRGYRFIAPVEMDWRAVSRPETPHRDISTSSPVDLVAHGGATPVAAVSAPPRETTVPDKVGAGADLRYGARWIAVAGMAAFTVVAALLALNTAGLRDRVATILGAGPARQREGGALPYPKIDSIAVLPLANLSRDPEQEYFADGMTEALITDLGKISALRVTSRTSVMHYKGTAKTLPEIARELNVDAVVEGAVMRSGDRVRITAQLIQAATDKHLWAETYDRDLGEVLTLQSEVAADITGEIKVKLTPEERARLTTPRPVNPESYSLYLQGRYHYSQDTSAAVDKGISLFQQALEKDPNNALAWASLAESYGDAAAGYSTSPKELFAKAKAAALKALEIDSSLAEAHMALGNVHLRWDWDWPAAEREFKTAIELKPSDASARSLYADYLETLGRHEQAIAESRRAQELDPLSPHMLNTRALAYMDAHRYDEAMEQCRKAVDLDPNFADSHACLGLIYILKGMSKEAETELETAARLGSPHSLDIDALIYAAAGRRDEARKLLGRVREQAKRGEMTPFAVAQFYIGLGDKQTALDWLEKAYDRRDPFMVTLKTNPFLDPLRSDPRFQALLRRMNFPP